MLDYLFRLRSPLNRSLTFENVVFKVPVFDPTIREVHYTFSVLDTLLPLSYVLGAVGPVHFSLSLSFIVDIVSYIDISTLPCEIAVTIFLIKHVHSFKSVTVSTLFLLPISFTVFMAFFEFSVIRATILPLILTISIRFSVSILSSVFITHRKHISSLAMFETVYPAPFKSITIFPLVNPVTIGLTIFPFS